MDRLSASGSARKIGPRFEIICGLSLALAACSAAACSRSRRIRFESLSADKMSKTVAKISSSNVRFSPELASGGERIDAGLFPPSDFVTRPVHFAMMAAAQRDDELVAHFAPECVGLCESKVMRV